MCTLAPFHIEKTNVSRFERFVVHDSVVLKVYLNCNLKYFCCLCVAECTGS